jgi:hypothetical protein
MEPMKCKFTLQKVVIANAYQLNSNTDGKCSEEARENWTNHI